MVISDELNILGLRFFNDRSEESFNELYAKLNPLFWNYVGKNFPRISLMGRKEIQSMFYENLWTKIHQYNPELPFTNWVMTIIKNLCNNHFRTVLDGKAFMPNRLSRYFLHIEFRFERNSQEDREFTAVTSTNNIDDWIEKDYEKFYLPIVNKAIENLEYPYAEVLDDKFIQNLTYEEIANKYNVPVNTAKTYVRTAIRRLRKQLFPSDKKRLESSRNHTAQEDLRKKGLYHVRVIDRSKPRGHTPGRIKITNIND